LNPSTRQIFTARIALVWVKTLLDHPALPHRFIKKLSPIKKLSMSKSYPYQKVIHRYRSYRLVQPPLSQFPPIDSANGFYVALTSVLCHAIDGSQVAGGARATRSVARRFSFRTGIADGSETFAIAADSDGEESHRSSTALWM
jgi:hypothetical protein